MEPPRETIWTPTPNDTLRPIRNDRRMLGSDGGNGGDAGIQGQGNLNQGLVSPRKSTDFTSFLLTAGLTSIFSHNPNILTLLYSVPLYPPAYHREIRPIGSERSQRIAAVQEVQGPIPILIYPQSPCRPKVQSTATGIGNYAAKVMRQQDQMQPEQVEKSYAKILATSLQDNAGCGQAGVWESRAALGNGPIPILCVS